MCEVIVQNKKQKHWPPLYGWWQVLGVILAATSKKCIMASPKTVKTINGMEYLRSSF